MINKYFTINLEFQKVIKNEKLLLTDLKNRADSSER
jgi:hypothetical protein